MQINVSQYENHRYINVEQIVDRSTKHVCTRCFKSDFDKFEFVFAFCMINKKQHEICENCFFRHKIMTCFLSKYLNFELYSQLIECSINLMRLKKFEIAEVVFSINAAFSADFIDERKKTRKFVRNRENDILTIDFFFRHVFAISSDDVCFFFHHHQQMQNVNDSIKIIQSMSQLIIVLRLLNLNHFSCFRVSMRTRMKMLFLSSN